jgi:flagellar basal body-associated protein FliL
MRKLFSSRKRIVIIVLAAIVVFGGAGAAYAYFSSTGTGTGQANVGSAATWTVTAGSASGTMYPGAGNSTIVYTVKNNASGEQQFSQATATVNSSGGNITQNGTAVSGCLATWFTATVSSDPSINTNIASGGTATITVTIAMPSSTTNQNACQGVTPDINLAVQ